MKLTRRDAWIMVKAYVAGCTIGLAVKFGAPIIGRNAAAILLAIFVAGRVAYGRGD